MNVFHRIIESRAGTVIGRVVGIAIVWSTLGALSLPGARELRGYAVWDGEVRLFLYNTDTEEGRWVVVGARFDGYRILRWDAARETVTLQKEAEMLSLLLVAGGVREADAVGETAETQALVENLRVLAVSACQHFLEQDVSSVSAAELVGPEKAVFQIEPVAGEDYDQIAFAVGPDGPCVMIDGESQPLPRFVEGLVIQVGPTLSLPAISRRLGIPLATLQRLNPQHAASDRFSAWSSVRLR